MRILYLSHCLPYPPDKGEKIRAYHEVRYLAEHHSVHVVCFSRTQQDAAAAPELEHYLRQRGGSLHTVPHARQSSLALAVCRFALGSCLTEAFYHSAALLQSVERVCKQGIDVTLVYSSAMAPYAPLSIPLVLDMVDVDSEKWVSYSQRWWPGFVFGWEAHRLQQLEIASVQRARRTYLTTRQEQNVLARLSPRGHTAVLENGVDLEYFDPAKAPAPPGQMLEKPAVVFVGAMDYYPNRDGAVWFATEVFPYIRQQHPQAEFWIVGRDPAPAVRRLGDLPGITVTGGVADVRGYLSGARLVVAPLRIARGIQNKVLEGLAMGKQVLATPEVCQTFGSDLPPGLIRCSDAQSMASQVTAGLGQNLEISPTIREAVRQRFHWDTNLCQLEEELRLTQATSPPI